ncbi:AAA family ATPase [Sorangium sp. So ce854]|uniref:AAA family ATPase n=1 Tax=Sorangium sp. So ce854 TaxID=3133322 RepID=UPI003F613391
MVKLKRLKIHRYRNVEPCELIFGDRRNVLLGPNGAGKTTLLSLISKILRTSLTDPGDPFSIEIELTFPEGTLTGKIASQAPDVDPTELLGLSTVAPAAHKSPYAARGVLDFDLVLTLAAHRETISIRGSEDLVTVQGADSSEDWPLDQFMRPPHLLAQLATIATLKRGKARIALHSDLGNACRFDESLDALHAFTAGQNETAHSNRDLRPSILALHFPRLATPRVYPVHGVVAVGMLEALKTGLPKGTTDYSMSHEQLSFLSEVVRLLGLRSATARIELISKHLQKGPPAERLELGNLKFWFTRRDGSIFQDQHLSYGQKRLLAFLYYLDANPSFVIADELVNGLHHAWIEECMNAIGDRQAFLTSQNPLLLDYLSFESAEQVKESFILCRNQADGDRERMIWRNMTDDEADMFYRAYQVGIEHVGEILRTRGLW